MFKHIHHRSWFPFVIVALSLTLIVFIVWAYVARQNNPTANFIEVPAVTMGQYQNETKLVMKDFFNQLTTQADDATRLAFVSETEQKLLALRVPAEGRSVHFELVSSLELLRQGFAGNPEKMTEGETRLRSVFSNNSWLNQ